MATIDLAYVDELISTRKLVHGGKQGAPKRLDSGARQGASINRSCIVMLSAQLQGYVEDVFAECAKKAIPKLLNDETWKAYWKTQERWGNPNGHNINRLFLSIGIENVLNGLSWEKCSNDSVMKKLDTINQIRNDIAHGKDTIKVGGKEYPLALADASALRDFAKAFGSRFGDHALSKC